MSVKSLLKNITVSAMVRVVCYVPTSFYSVAAVDWFFSLPVQVLHGCILNRVSSVLGFKMSICRVQRYLEQEYRYTRDRDKWMRGINNI